MEGKLYIISSTGAKVLVMLILVQRIKAITANISSLLHNSSKCNIFLLNRDLKKQDIEGVKDDTVLTVVWDKGDTDLILGGGVLGGHKLSVGVGILCCFQNWLGQTQLCMGV